MKWLASIFCMFMSLLAATPAKALICNMTVSNVTFGNIDVLSGSAVDTTATVSVNCTVGVPLTTVRACLNINNGSGGADSGGRTMTGSGGSLKYQLYQDAAHTTIWGSTTWGLTGGPGQIDVPIGLGATGSASATLYGRVFGGQTTAAAGSYSSTFAGNETLFNYNVTTVLSCAAILGLPQIGTNPTFNVTATVVNNCHVSAQDLDFGTQGVLNVNTDATGQVSAICTPDAPYTIGLSNGNSGVSPGARKMSKGAETITYGLYKDAAHSQLWGDTIGVDTVAGTGSGSAQNLTVYGRVPAQTTPTSGSYSDTVVVTLTY